MITVLIALVLFVISRLIEIEDGPALLFWGLVFFLIVSCKSDFMIFFK